GGSAVRVRPDLPVGRGSEGARAADRAVRPGPDEAGLGARLSLRHRPPVDTVRMSGLTPSQTVGPFFAIGLCRESQNEVVPGGSVRIVGRVLDGQGDPVPDAVVELWQQADGGTRWGRCGTDAEGRFDFVTERPQDGVADVMVFARG